MRVVEFPSGGWTGDFVKADECLYLGIEQLAVGPWDGTGRRCSERTIVGVGLLSG